MNLKKILFAVFCIGIPMVLLGATIRWYNDAGISQKTTMTGTEIFSMQQTGPNVYRWGYLNDIMRGWISTNDTRDIVLGGSLTIPAISITGTQLSVYGIPILRIQTNTIPAWPYAPNNLILGDGGTLLTTNTPWPVDPLVLNGGQSNFVGQLNTFIGFQAGASNTSGYGNVYIGNVAGISNTVGDQNVFVGWYSGFGNTDGYHNTYLGAFAGMSFTNGNYNTVVGCDAVGNGLANGDGNTVVGSMAGGMNISASNLTLVGRSAGGKIVRGYENTFVGASAGEKTTNGKENVGVGYIALKENLVGDYNVAVGNYSLAAATNSNNTGVGYQSLDHITSGTDNTSLGYRSGWYASNTLYSTFLGAMTDDATGQSTNSTAIGYGANVTTNNQIVLGNANVTQVVSRGVYTGNGSGLTNFLYSGLFFSQHTSSGVTNSTDETTVATIPMIGGSIGLNGVVRVSMQFEANNATEMTNLIARIYYGAIKVADWGAVTSATGAKTAWGIREINNLNSLSSQKSFATFGLSGAVGGSPITAAFNTSTNFTMYIKMLNTGLGQTNWLGLCNVEVLGKN